MRSQHVFTEKKEKLSMKFSPYFLLSGALLNIVASKSQGLRVKKIKMFWVITTGPNPG